MDLRAIQKFKEHFEQANLLKPTKAHLLLNMYDGKTRLGADAFEAVDALELPVLDTKIAQRVAYAEAVVEGKGVFEHRDPKAKAELVALTKELLTHMK